MKPKKQTKSITYKLDNDDNAPISKEIYDKILEEEMDEILKMGTEINYSNLVDHFKGITPSINFAIIVGPTYTYDQIKVVKKHLKN